MDEDELFELKCKLHNANKKIESLEAELSFLESLYKVAIKERDYERQINENLNIQKNTRGLL